MPVYQTTSCCERNKARAATQSLFSKLSANPLALTAFPGVALVLAISQTLM